MEITVVGDNLLRGTAEGVLLVAVRGTYDVLRTAKLPIACAWFEKESIIQFSQKV